MSHFLGSDFTPNPSPKREAGVEGTSLAVRQFCAFAFGIAAPHSPSQPWRVTEVVFETRYCLKCFGLRGHDVVKGHLHEVSYCRCCGAEVRYG